MSPWRNYSAPLGPESLAGGRKIELQLPLQKSPPQKRSHEKHIIPDLTQTLLFARQLSNDSFVKPDNLFKKFLNLEISPLKLRRITRKGMDYDDEYELLDNQDFLGFCGLVIVVHAFRLGAFARKILRKFPAKSRDMP